MRLRAIAPALAVAALAAAVPATADAAVSTQARIELPAGFLPEGITTVTGGSAFFAGSMVDGRIVTGDVRTGALRTLTPGTTGRALRGMAYDPRTRLLWAVGTQGSQGIVLAVDSRSGAVRWSHLIAGAAFVNDLTITPGAVWVTDSGVDRLTRVALQGGLPVGEPTFLPLTGAWPTAGDLRANGIRSLVDGSLLLDHSSAGGLWRVDPATGVTTAVPIKGGSLTGGDGLELAGNTAFVVRGNDNYSVSVLTLGYGAGRSVTATWRRTVTDPGLDVPSTTSRAGKYLFTINARFGVADPTSASYWITRLPATT
ncbi:hypothetical protein CLV35_2791 [Motilibacter peucedani]|uniref:Sugar lactone lactonase YvrE n=1 Tax=Motilibacter peucedani TaxID=598650 RepID=A0A420XMP6_9ACTN|nr:hypothetical protein [Motilibacter peucedani]RKS72545.1 hypothetical protein CLV35_2791 [Motilibacter peucedani]